MTQMKNKSIPPESSKYGYRSRTDIAIFLPSFAGGGAERVMIDLSNRFHRLGYTVDLVLCNCEGPLKSTVNSGIKIVDFAKSKPREAIFALRKYIRKKRPKAILSSLTHANIACSLSCKISGNISRLVLCEQIDITQCIQAISTPFDAWLNKILIKFLYPRAHKIIAVSKGTAQSLAEFSNIDSEEIEIIYNFIDTKRIKKPSLQPIQFPWNDPLPVILSAGRLSYQKDFSCLLQAFAILKKNCPAHLIILGEGEERENLEKQAKASGILQDIWLPGFTSNPYNFMSNSDLFVLSSRFEGLPVVLVEALTLNVPIVSTRCPSGPFEILNGGDYGRLVPVDDPFALAEAMESSLAGDHPVFDKSKALERFQPDLVVNQYLEALGFAEHSEKIFKSKS